MAKPPSELPRPLSPNIQIYRPQLTSVLSIANRMSGVALSLYAVGLVIWLIAAATGPEAYATMHGFITSWVGQVLLFGCTFCFFLHLCGGIRHLAWDAGYGFSLRAIYSTGWAVVAATTVLTVLTWVVTFILMGQSR
jgi:succinate dehydrogenase / fumarate reductase cytochrome b subunit